MKLRILADDLTGALDAAAPLAGVASSRRVPVYLESPHASDAEVQTLAIATRDVDPETLPQRLSKAVPWLADADLSFKKIDSLLRGNTFAEVAHLALTGPFERVIFAPAFPAQGRLTRADRHRVHETVAAGPTLSSKFERLGVSAQALHRVDAGALPAARILIPDIETDADLLRLVALADNGSADKWLWCGSAGMARAWARHLGVCDRPAASELTQPRPLLCISASIHPAWRAQWAALREQQWCETLAGDASGLRRAAQALASNTGVALDLASPLALNPPQAAEALAATMEALVDRLPRPAQAVVIGGDTLLALCRASGVTHLAALPEGRTGWGRCELVGGRWNGLVCRTRSGAFGAADDLCSVLDRTAPSPTKETQ